MVCIKQIVNDVFASNTYVLSYEDSNDFWLVDVGDFNKVIDYLPAGANIRGVFLTHSHFDHMYGLNEMNKYFPHSVVFTSEYGKEAIYSEKKNLSYYHETPVTYLGENIIILKNLDEIELWNNVIIKVFSTPGHCLSCLSYIIQDYIFTGDSYIPGFSVVTKLPKGNVKNAKSSLDKILKMSKNKTICPGHGEIKLRQK